MKDRKCRRGWTSLGLGSGLTSNTSRQPAERRWEIGGIGTKKQYNSRAQAHTEKNSYACIAVAINTSSQDHGLDLQYVRNRYLKEFVRKRGDARKVQKSKLEVIFIKKEKEVLRNSWPVRLLSDPAGTGINPQTCCGKAPENRGESGSRQCWSVENSSSQTNFLLQGDGRSCGLRSSSRYPVTCFFL